MQWQKTNDLSDLILPPETAASLATSFDKRRQTASKSSTRIQRDQDIYCKRPSPTASSNMPKQSSRSHRHSAPVDLDDAITEATPNTLEAGMAGSHALMAARSVLQNGGSKAQAEQVVLSILMKGKLPSQIKMDRLLEVQTQAKMLVNMAKNTTSQPPRQSNLGQILDEDVEITSRQHNTSKSKQAPSKPADDRKQRRRRKPQPVRLRINRGASSWVAHGYKGITPKEGKTYFSNLSTRMTELPSRTGEKDRQYPPRVISVCIPCFNEEASALKRTIESLQKSYLPRGVALEMVVAMDGLKQIDPSMAVYLRTVFGISVNEEDPKKNPFVTFPKANTVVVENTTPTLSRHNLSLVIKRNNKRKVNSQKWWLFGHARDAQCEFAFATDCGIVFDRKCLMYMVERMDREPNLSGLTGYQRVMSSQMQGEGRFEIFTDPMGAFLRQLQSYDFEMSQSTTKSLVDSFGFIPVLPGPCSLFRFKHFEGIVDEYFTLTTQPLAGDASDIVMGNVQLAEDRFPPVLLTFRDKENPIGTRTNRPVTGFEHDAVFYFECEKPLGQLVKQRRRWINGAYMAGYWVLKEKWIRESNNSWITKMGASMVLFFELMQGALIRLITPATLACGLFFMVTMLPSIYYQDKERVREILDGEPVDDMLQIYAGAAAAWYLLLFAIFMFAHTPKAAAMKNDQGETFYQIDSKSAYRPWLFLISFVVNALIAVMFIYVGVGVYMMIGWYDSPIYFKVLSLMICVPYVVALFDGFINSKRPSIRAFWNLIWLTPVFTLASIWFYVWFPSYASARISDLSWGNRAAHQESFASSQVARHRAYLGRVVSVTIVVSNLLAAGLILGVMKLVSEFLTVVLFSLLGFNSLLHAINLVDMFFRVFTRKIPHLLCGEPPPPLQLRADNISDTSSEDESDDDFTLDEYTVDTHIEPSASQDADPYCSSDTSDDEVEPYYGNQYMSPTHHTKNRVSV